MKYEYDPADGEYDSYEEEYGSENNYNKKSARGGK
jgi:hypothetical protein